MPIVEGIEQQSSEWLQMRCGMVTASRMADVMAKLKRKDGEAAARSDYRHEIVIERLTGRSATCFVNDAMQWGIEQEPVARAAYEISAGVDTDPIGFAIHPRIAFCGASPDALVGNEGLLEIKCPASSTHLDTLISKEVPERYLWQMLAEMACTERQWCDFVSFDPRFPRKYQLFIKRVPRDEALISAMELETEQFLKEVNETLAKLEAE